MFTSKLLAAQFVKDYMQDPKNVEWDFDYDNLEVTHVEANKYGITEVSYEGDVALNTTGWVAAEYQDLIEALAELIEKGRPNEHFFEKVEKAIREELKDTIILINGGDGPVPFSLDGVCESILANLGAFN